MSDFVPTHRSRAGVEVKATRYPNGNWHYELTRDVGCCCGPIFFDALFEPIPKPLMVRFPLTMAKAMLQWSWMSCFEREALQAAIAAAEKETSAERGVRA